MLPAVAKIVLVAEPHVEPQAQVAQAHLLRVVGKKDATGLGDAVLLAMDHKAVEVGVGPAEGDLEDVMQVGERGVAADEQSAPDGGADVE